MGLRRRKKKVYGVRRFSHAVTHVWWEALDRSKASHPDHRGITGLRSSVCCTVVAAAVQRYDNTVVPALVLCGFSDAMSLQDCMGPYTLWHLCVKHLHYNATLVLE